MAYNYAFIKEDLENITLEDFKTVMAVCLKSGINHIAPLGCSGDDFNLYGRFIPSSETADGNWKRESCVSIRNYCGTPELLISDKSGNTLFYGKFYHMEFEDLSKEYFRIFNMLKDKIGYEHNYKRLDLKILDDAIVDDSAFELLAKYVEETIG